MENGSNQVGGFIRCSMRELGGKSYNLMFSEGKGVAGGGGSWLKNYAKTH